MPAGLSQTQKEIFLKLTRPHFLLFSPDSVQDYGNFVTFVAQNIHFLPYCKLESSVVMRGERNYQNATISIKAALQKPRNNSAQSALMRLRLADKLEGVSRTVFLNATDRTRWNHEIPLYVYRNYLIMIYQKIDGIVTAWQKSEALTMASIWEAVTGNSMPTDVNSSNFFSRQVALNPEPVEPEDQSENISLLQKTIVSSTPRDPLLFQIVKELTDSCPKDFPGKDNVGRVTLTSFQTKLYTAVRPWVSERTPNYINDFILALLQPYQERLKDQTNWRVAFENLLAEIRGFDRVRQDSQGLQTLKGISEQGAPPAEVISFLRETVKSTRKSEEQEKNKKRLEEALAEMKLERFAVRSDGDCFYHAAAFLLGKDGAMDVRRDLERFFNEKPWRARVPVPDPTFNEQKGINVDDPNSGNDSDRKRLSSLDSEVQEMLRQFDFWQENVNAGPSTMIAERMDQLAQKAANGLLGRSADRSQEKIPGEWGTLDLIPLLVHIYQRPIGFIAPNVRDSNDKIRPIICRIDLFRGKSLNSEDPLWLLFNGSDHWDATYNRKFKKLEKVYGSEFPLFLNQLNQFLEKIPETATEEDLEFLTSLMLDPSMTQVSAINRLEVMEQIKTWYFKHPPEARNPRAKWYPQDRKNKVTGDEMWENGPVDPKKICLKLYSSLTDKNTFIPLLYQSISAAKIKQDTMLKTLHQDEEKDDKDNSFNTNERMIKSPSFQDLIESEDPFEKEKTKQREETMRIAWDLFLKIPQQILIERRNPDQNPFNSISFEAHGNTLFADFLEYIIETHGTASRLFLVQMTQSLKAIPDTATQEDREFLISLMLHPSMAQVTAKDRPDVIDLV